MNQITCQEDVNEGLAKLLRQCADLKPIASQCPQLPLRLSEGGFAGLSRIIIGQQVSVASAAAIHLRYVDRIKPVTPEAYLTAGEAVWTEIGLSRPKQAALMALSEAIVSGTLSLDDIHLLSAIDAKNALIEIKGIGPWTAQVYLLFCCGHMDIFPAGDLALQEGVKAALKLEKRPNEQELNDISAAWAPYRGIAARLFWSYYSKIKSGNDKLPV